MDSEKMSQNEDVVADVLTSLTDNISVMVLKAR